MNTSQLIQAKFQSWAKRNKIRLQGSKGRLGTPNYAMSVGENIFGGTLARTTRTAFNDGAGGELRGEICSMQALHSSAAMAVNVFQYWSQNQEYETLAKILRIPSRFIEKMTFERKFPVCAEMAKNGFKEPPHLDVAIEYSKTTRIGIECKLHEPFGRLQKSLLRDAYLNLDGIWDDIPKWRKLAVELNKSDFGFKRLGPAQLVKHVLGLKHEKHASDIRLLYFYFDGPGSENCEHLNELNRFSELVADDPVKFVPLSAQEFISHATEKLPEKHFAYLNYLSERYF